MASSSTPKSKLLLTEEIPTEQHDSNVTVAMNIQRISSISGQAILGLAAASPRKPEEKVTEEELFTVDRRERMY